MLCPKCGAQLSDSAVICRACGAMLPEQPAAAQAPYPPASQPAETADIWTFSRHITSPDPAWLLIATDAEA